MTCSMFITLQHVWICCFVEKLKPFCSRECAALGGLFQQVVNDMKVGENMILTILFVTIV